MGYCGALFSRTAGVKVQGKVVAMVGWGVVLVCIGGRHSGGLQLCGRRSQAGMGACLAGALGGGTGGR